MSLQWNAEFMPTEVGDNPESTRLRRRVAGIVGWDLIERTLWANGLHARKAGGSGESGSVERWCVPLRFRPRWLLGRGPAALACGSSSCTRPQVLEPRRPSRQVQRPWGLWARDRVRPHRAPVHQLLQRAGRSASALPSRRVCWLVGPERSLHPRPADFELVVGGPIGNGRHITGPLAAAGLRPSANTALTRGVTSGQDVRRHAA